MGRIFNFLAFISEKPFQQADSAPPHPQSPRSPGLSFPPGHKDVSPSCICLQQKCVINSFFQNPFRKCIVRSSQGGAQTELFAHPFYREGSPFCVRVYNGWVYNVHTAHLQYENKKNYEPELPLLSQAQEASIFCCKSPAMIVNYIMVLYDEMKGLGRNTKEEDKEIHCDI